MSSSNFQQKQLYPSDDISDILICFKYRTYSAPENSNDWSTFPSPDNSTLWSHAGHALLQPYFLNDKWLERKVSVMNLNFVVTTGVYQKSAMAPSLLRVGGKAPTAFNKGIILFLDDTFMFSNYVDSLSTNPRKIFCGFEYKYSSIPTTCTLYLHRDTPAALTNYKSYINHNYVFITPTTSTLVSVADEFNLFLGIDLKTSGNQITALEDASAFIGLLAANSAGYNTNSYFDLNFVTRIAGAVNIRYKTNSALYYYKGLNLGRLVASGGLAGTTYSAEAENFVAQTTQCAPSGATAIGIFKGSNNFKPFGSMSYLEFAIFPTCSVSNENGLIINDYNYQYISASSVVDLSSATASVSGVTNGFGSGFIMVMRINLFEGYDVKNLKLIQA